MYSFSDYYQWFAGNIMKCFDVYQLPEFIVVEPIGSTFPPLSVSMVMIGRSFV